MNYPLPYYVDMTRDVTEGSALLFRVNASLKQASTVKWAMCRRWRSPVGSTTRGYISEGVGVVYT